MATYVRFDGGVLGGVAGCSGDYPALTDWTKVDVEQKKKTPVIVWHGFDDAVVPAEYARNSY